MSPRKKPPKAGAPPPPDGAPAPPGDTPKRTAARKPRAPRAGKKAAAPPPGEVVSQRAATTEPSPQPQPEPEPQPEPQPAPAPAPAPLATAPTAADDAGSTDEAAADDDYLPPPEPPPGRLRARAIELLRQLEEELRSQLDVQTGDEEHRKRPPLGFVWKRLRALAMRDRSELVDEFGRDPRVYDEVAPLLEFFYRKWFRVEARGLGNVPSQGRGLIVGNHSGTVPWDAAMVMYGLLRDHPAHREVRPLVEDFVFHFPYLGTLMNRLGGVRACPENAERLLRGGNLVAVFPEGIKGIGKLFSQRYQLQRFGRGGFIRLALATDAPIIPAAIVGAEEIHPMLARVTWLSKAFGVPYLPVTPTFPLLGALGAVPLPTRWFIAYGEPLHFGATYGPDAVRDRILVGKLTEQVRQRIQEMVDGLLAERRSVFFG